jgi:hypothetical protein
MMGNIQAIEVEIPYEVVQYWGWFLVFGIGLLALGILRGQVGVGHRRHDVVLRMALGVGLRHRDRAGGLGGAPSVSLGQTSHFRLWLPHFPDMPK